MKILVMVRVLVRHFIGEDHLSVWLLEAYEDEGTSNGESSEDAVFSHIKEDCSAGGVTLLTSLAMISLSPLQVRIQPSMEISSPISTWPRHNTPIPEGVAVC